MLSNDDLINTLKKDKLNIERKINNYKLTNIGNRTMVYILKAGIKINYIRPYILSGVVFSLLGSSLGNRPYFADDIVVSASIETIDTSSSLHLENISYDNDFEEKLEYTSGWITNDEGLYTRTSTTYRLTPDFDLSNTNKVLSMPKEEIEKILEISNIEVITTNYLTPDDFIYYKDAVIVTNVSSDKNMTKIRKETSNEVILDSILYFLVTTVISALTLPFEKRFLKFNIQDKLKILEQKFKPISEDDLITLKKILSLKEENLRMLDKNSKNLPSYQLRKK